MLPPVSVEVQALHSAFVGRGRATLQSLCSIWWAQTSYCLKEVGLSRPFFGPSAFLGARGQIGVAAASPCHSHSHARSKLHLPFNPQLAATLDL